MSSQLVCKPQGIITEPNKVGQFPPGALAYAANAAIRSFGVLEQVPKCIGINGFLPNAIVGGVYMVQDGDLLVILAELGSLGSWRLFYEWTDPITGGATIGVITLASPFNTYITNDERTGILLMRNRLIVAGTVRSFAFDFIFNTPGSPPSAVVGPRNCGAYQPGILGRGFSWSTTNTGGILGPNTHMSACAVQRSKHSDGYELISPPSVPYDFPNLHASFSQISADWTYRTVLTVTSGSIEQFFDLYRTREQSVGYDSVNNRYTPVATGSSFYQIASVNTSTGTFGLAEHTCPQAFGEALFTNVSVAGASALPLPPLPAKTACEYRNYAFYANVFDPATVTLQGAYYWGNIPDNAEPAFMQQAIGVRYLEGTSANGSATVTLTGISYGYGITVEQDIIVTRQDTGATVLNSKILSENFGARTITATTNATYTGAVYIYVYDIIEINGTRFRANYSPSLFAYNVTATSNFNSQMDITAVGLEPYNTKPISSAYPEHVPTGGLSLRMRTNASISIAATNGGNYLPELPHLGIENPKVFPGKHQPNMFIWSEENQPEYCAPSNSAFAGSGEIYKVIATRDCLWFFCSDGLYRLSGNGGSVGTGYDWVLDPVDPTLILVSPQCATVAREYVYAYTNRGLVSISSEGVVRSLSDGRINPSNYGNQEHVLNKTWDPQSTNGIRINASWMTTDVGNAEVWLRTRDRSGGTPVIWVYNIKTDTFTQRLPSLFPNEVPTLGVYYPTYYQQVNFVYANRSTVGVTGLPIYGDFEAAIVVFQPVYGGKSNSSAHTQKHWQDIQLSFRTPQDNPTATVTLRSVNAGSVGTRSIPTNVPVSAGYPVRETSRTGFTIPRNFPAMGNSFAFGLVISSSTVEVGQSPIALEAYSVNFLEFTDQRVVR